MRVPAESVNLNEVFDFFYEELSSLTEPEFSKKAAEIAVDEGFDVALVRAIGKGSLTRDIEASKNFIRGYLEQVSNDKITRRERRQILATFFDVTPETISAYYATRKNARQHESQPAVPNATAAVSAGINRVLSEDEKARIRAYVEQGETTDDKKRLRQEAAKLFNLEVKRVSALTAWSTMWASGKTSQKGRGKEAAEASSGHTETEENSPTSEQPSPTGEGHNSPSSLDGPHSPAEEPQTPQDEPTPAVRVAPTGAHIEYNNEIKNKWRERICTFLSERIPEEKRADMKVLCFPGKTWQGVTDIYLKLGFSPENIYGVERDEEAQQEFENNAERLGCKTYFGELKDFATSPEAPIFDITELDFLGALSEGYVELAENIRATDHAFLLTNVMTKREQPSAALSEAKALDERVRAGEAPLPEKKLRAQSDFFAQNPMRGPEYREAVTTALSLKLSKKYINPFFEPIIAQLYEDVSSSDTLGFLQGVFEEQILPRIAEKIYKNNKSMTKAQKEVLALNKEGFERNIKAAFEQTMRNQRVPVSCQRFKYVSLAGASPTTFYSDFIELNYNSEKREKGHQAVKLLLELVVRRLTTKSKQIEVSIGTETKVQPFLASGSRSIEVTKIKVGHWPELSIELDMLFQLIDIHGDVLSEVDLNFPEREMIE